METKETIPSRTGGSFIAEIETEHDGALTILTIDMHGYRSAHRDYAAKHFGTHNLWKMNHLSWINANNVRVALTRWNRKE